jgi:hypothetical protein
VPAETRTRAFLLGQGKYHVVIGRLQAVVTHVRSVVTVLPQTLGDQRG